MTGNGVNGNGRFASIFYAVLIGMIGAQWVAIASLTWILLPLASVVPLQTDDRYRRSNAEADFRLRDSEINSLKDRVRELETFHNVERRR